MSVLFMVLGLLLLGTAIGAAAAGVWLLAGGSFLLGIAIYGLVGTLVVLGVALLSFFLGERKAVAAARPLQAAE
jgi:hypothetical protein